jgi:hypothetical protein
LVAAVPSGLNWTPPPTIPIKKFKKHKKFKIFSCEIEYTLLLEANVSCHLSLST